jgi:hypothetical protein
METNLGSIIKNDKARQIIYATWFILGIVIGAVQVAYTDPDPLWVLKAFDVWSYLGLPIAALATANSQSKPDVVYAPEANPKVINTDKVVLGTDTQPLGPGDTE